MQQRVGRESMTVQPEIQSPPFEPGPSIFGKSQVAEKFLAGLAIAWRFGLITNSTPKERPYDKHQIIHESTDI